MNKPDALRAALAAVFPVFANNGDALKMWVDRGGIVARQGSNRAFEYRYTLNLVITDLDTSIIHPSAIFLAVNDWLETQQPDLLTPANTPSYPFEADILDASKIDLSIELALSEAVRVTPRDGGGWNLEHKAEEVPLFPDMDPMTTPAAPLTEIWWGEDLLIPHPA